jgi:hypothetical protein
MRQEIINYHNRLETIMLLIKKCDWFMNYSKEHFHAFKEKAIGDNYRAYTIMANDEVIRYNKFKAIRTRLERWYADVFTRMAKFIESRNNAKPITPLMSADMVNQYLANYKY